MRKYWLLGHLWVFSSVLMYWHSLNESKRLLLANKGNKTLECDFLRKIVEKRGKEELRESKILRVSIQFFSWISSNPNSLDKSPIFNVIRTIFQKKHSISKAKQVGKMDRHKNHQKRIDCDLRIDNNIWTKTTLIIGITCEYQ